MILSELGRTKTRAGMRQRVRAPPAGGQEKNERLFSDVDGSLRPAQNQIREIGRRRTGFFVSANSAFATAGAIGGVPGSPIPPSGSPLVTMCVSIAGISFMRSIL